MDEGCRAEIEELHRFFQDWFNGVLAPTEDHFVRFSSVMADGFQIIFPNGRIMGREELVRHVREAHGMYSSRGAPVRIRVSHCHVRPLAKDLLLVTYEERQEGPDASRGRLSTAVLRRRDGMPNGVEWLHVHEAWLPVPS